MSDSENSTLIPCGEITRDKQGNLVLINKNGKAFSINKEIYALWRELTSSPKSFTQIKSSLDQQNILESKKTERLISKLRKADLIQ